MLKESHESQDEHTPLSRQSTSTSPGSTATLDTAQHTYSAVSSSNETSLDRTASRNAEAIALRHLLSDRTEQDLGDIRPIEGVQTTLPMGQFAQHAVRYPTVVVEALTDLFREYNQHFQPLVADNREFSTDYQATRDRNGHHNNCFVQIDMVGLSPQFLKTAERLDKDLVREVLRGAIFEIENSMAMYQLLERVFSNESGQSVFKMRFRRALDDLRTQHSRPIALLAVTDEKLTAMRESEFGKRAGEPLSDEEIKALSGFDTLLGPDDLRRHVAANKGRCEFLLYVRASDPPVKLRDPRAQVGNPLLEDAELRRIIKANALTLNVDSPAQTGKARINDTKGYLQSMGMGFNISGLEQVVTPQGTLASGFRDYLVSRGIDPTTVEQRTASLRAKPLRGTYGCYGHVRGVLNSEFKRQLRLETEARGEYVVQPEMTTPTVVHSGDGSTYTYIDRNFFSCTGGEIQFLGGTRTLMPVDSKEARNGRIHGSHQSVYQQVY